MNQMQRLVEDLSDTARVTASAIQLRRSNVDLLQQLRDLSTVWQSVAEDQRKSFVSSVPHGSMMLWADADRLQQVLSNVVGNAFKYTPPGGRVSVTVQREHDFATVIVQDEGEGIPAERLPHIFELFQRATSSASGLGVGLAVVNALVRAHGGTVAAASDGLGRGTTITVRLPLAHSGLTEGQPTSPL